MTTTSTITDPIRGVLTGVFIIMNCSSVVILPTGFDTSIVTFWEITGEEGIPEIIPESELRVIPVGRDPDVILKDG